MSKIAKIIALAKAVHGGSNSSGGGSVPGCNEPFKQLVTDDSGKAVWEEKLVYDDTITSVLLEEQQFEALLQHAQMAGWENPLYLVENANLSKSVGAHLNFIVMWNGVRYECEKKSYCNGQYNIIGNARRFLWENGLKAQASELIDTEEPFAIMQIGGLHTMLYPTDGEIVFTAGISIVEHNLKTIDPKYITGSELTESDEGAFLRVVNGAIALQHVPNAEGASF